MNEPPEIDQAVSSARLRRLDRRLPAAVLTPLIGSLLQKVPRDHQESDGAFLRRRIVAVFTLLLGATVLGFSLAVKPGDPLFYPLTLLLAGLWLGGGFLSGPLHVGRIFDNGTLRRPLLSPLLLGIIVGVVFVAGALVVREIAPLKSLVDQVLDHARYGSTAAVLAITVLNGAAEEVFFRGALFAAIGRRHPVLISTAIYAVVTVATGNAMLVFAASVLGLVLGLQRRASGGLLAPIITHVTWSVIMFALLPPLLNNA